MRPTIGAGVDTILGVEDLTGSTYGDTLSGDGQSNKIDGGIGNDSLAGLGAADTLVGGAGSDTLDGGSGNDVLTGGAARDLLIGNTGADRFTFAVLTESTVAASGQDTILDSNAGEGDRLDLSLLGKHTPGGLKLVVAFTNTPGQLTQTAQGDGYLMRVDVNGDAVADFAVFVRAAVALTTGEFIL